LNGAPSPPHHHQAVFRLAQIFVRRQRDGVEMSDKLGRIGMRQHCHCRLALCLFAVFVHNHIGLAGIKLSMVLDNLIMKRHDCFVTTE